MTAVRTEHVTLDRVFRRWVRITQRVTAEQLHSGDWTEATAMIGGASGPKLLSVGPTYAGLLTAPMLPEEPTLSLTGQMLGENPREMVELQVMPEQLVIDEAEHERVPPSLR